MKKLLIICAGLLLSLSVSAHTSDVLKRKISRKFSDISNVLRPHEQLEVTVVFAVNQSGKLEVLESSSPDEQVNQYLRQKLESISLSPTAAGEVFQYHFVFKKEKNNARL